MTRPFTRRGFLARSALIGCSAAASPFLTRISLAAAPWDARLVVIVLRGAMDGLDVVQPYGDPDYARARGALAGGPQNGAAELDGFFSLHPALGTLMPLWAAGELGFVHAVSTPYREKRSHFDGQDILEAGTDTLGAVRDGWLNRLLTRLPGVETRTAFAIGHGEMKILGGAAPVADWTPEVDLALSPQAMQLAERIMQEDPAFHAAFAEASMLAGGGMGGADKAGAHLEVAKFAAEQLRGDTRIAAFSINGWDTHGRQHKTLIPALERLAGTLTSLRDTLGPAVWGKTAVVAMTEFGRTVRINGTGGTDHGTGGAMVLAGGAIRGGKVHGTWPGLDEASLFERRDLMPTADVRAPAAWLLHGLTGLDRAAIEQVVFPGLDMGRDAGFLR
ncbi:DUF1501 domain-containing protein [Seohaeicola zhoushanensis]|uniref:Twin-arginine translocation pathway signal n=1 Tax=Seohaeicola zhoushanensis TaxID=1569283 RepID=A0A8J3M5U5_9RHOB|nr:DUF1501 domain-containing protein [Seohaeicola zhoushanensis]GHF40845.1 hypothetical protein GCM10017056_10560 [Seohaeicola zhoushanensis]